MRAALVLALALAGPPLVGQATPSTWALLASNASALGAVLDVRRPHVDGITVLAITPGGAAEQMGLEVGDRLLVVNGRSLTDTLTPNDTLEGALAGGGPVNATVSRGNRTIELSSSTPIAASAQLEGCGYITNRGTLPHVSENLYPVRILSIDGGGQPVDANRHRLPAGTHAVIVSERIRDDRFDPLELRARTDLYRRDGFRVGKTLVVEVKPGIRTRLAARFLEDGMDLGTIRDNAYWEPLVWEEVEDACP